MFNKRKTLSAAIHLACSGVVASGLLLSGMVSAEEDAVKLEKEEVTGSHIKQIDIEGASPVAVISREDIELSGLQSVADVLRRTPYNSFGSFRETSGNSFAGQALVDMRGLGAGRTLVLLNGRRMPASPITGNLAVDLNVLPLAAIERIEILKESASAVYGSEAIGGVINIILRSDYEGVELSGTVERPNEKGADAESAHIVAGGVHSRGKYIASLEWAHKDIIFSRDRPWSDVNLGDGKDFLTTENISINGNTWQDPADGTWFAGSPCAAPFSGVYDFESIGFPDKVCTYPYADISAETSEVTRANSFLYLDYEINNDTTLYVQNLLSRVESFGRYAPALGMFAVSADNPINPFGRDMFLRHRFAAVGPRDDTATNWQWDAMVGVKGAFHEIDYDAYVRYNLYNADIIGRNYILKSEAETQVDSGDYNPFDPFSTDPAHLAAIAMMRHDNSRQSREEYFSAGFNLTSEMPVELSGGNISWAAGYEYRDESFSDIYDAERTAGNVLGSAGSSSQGDRTQYAIYGELLFPVMDDLELTAALRYDHYSDFGGEMSPQIKARWQPMDNLLVRASWGEGFRAPSLQDLYQKSSFSAESVKDFVFCQANGVTNCPTRQEDTFFGGNPDLEAEESESWNLGVVFEPIEDLVLEADYYDIQLDNVIETIAPQNLINLEAAGIGLPAGTAIVRTAGGRIDHINSVTANISSREVDGIDLGVSYIWDMGEWGTVKPHLTWTHMFSYDFQATPVDDVSDLAGLWNGGPDDRVQLVTSWTVSDFTVGWIVDYIDSMDADPNNIDSYAEHSFTVSWASSWDADITLGVRNAFDEKPPIDTTVDDANNFYYLYPIDGRVWSLTYKQSF